MIANVVTASRLSITISERKVKILETTRLNGSNLFSVENCYQASKSVKRKDVLWLLNHLECC